MKSILTIIAIAIMVISCKAQTPIVAIDANMSETPKGAYYKDLKKELNKFVGTWKYTNGTTSLTFVLQKKEKIFALGDYYDALKGEYKYIENGIVVINTIPTFKETPDTSKRNIGGGYILKSNENPSCGDCGANERRIDMYFNDPGREYLNSSVVLRYLPVSSPAKIIAVIYADHGSILPNENSPTAPRVPYGTYTLTKQ